VVAQLALVPVVPARLVVAALALGNTVGLTTAAVPLVVVTRRVLGSVAVEGVGRATLVGLAAAVGAAVVGVAASLVVPAHGKLSDAAAAVLAAGLSLVVFGAIAFVLDEADTRPVLALVLRTARLRPVRRGGHDRGGLVRSWRYPAREQWRMEGRRQMLTIRSANQQDGREANHGQPPGWLMTRRERQVAFAIGVLAGGGGGYAVFASSNQAGTVVLLLISMLFLMMGVEGTPLLRLAARPGAQQAGRLHRVRAAQRVEPTSSQLEAGMVDDIALPEPTADGQHLATSAAPDDGSGVFTTE
jgi:hypothetical protein